MKTNYTNFIAILLIAICGFFALANNAQAALADIQVCENSLFDGGDGTSENPWQISSAQELANVTFCSGSEYDDAYFILTSNIDLTGFVNQFGVYSDMNGWVPIGSYIEDVEGTLEYNYGSFEGDFNGNGYVVSGLSIDRTNTQYELEYGPVEPSHQGLFGVVLDASIYDLGINDFEINARFDAAALAAWVQSGTNISGVYSSNGSVYSNNGSGGSAVAGLVGSFESSGTQSIIADSYVFDVYIEGVDSSNIGGLVGFVGYNSLVERSYSNAELSLVESEWLSMLGGLVGGSSSDFEVSDSFSVSSMSGEEPGYKGGIVGKWGNPAGENNYWFDPQEEIPNCVGNQSVDESICASQVDPGFFTDVTSDLYTNWDIEVTSVEDYVGVNEGLPFLSWQENSNSSVWMMYQAESGPVVTTLDIADLTQTSARLFGSLDDQTYFSVIEYGFNYGLEDSYGESVNYEDEELGVGPFEFGYTIEGLTCGTTYHYQAYIRMANSEIVEGQDATFTTEDCEEPEEEEEQPRRRSSGGGKKKVPAALVQTTTPSFTTPTTSTTEVITGVRDLTLGDEGDDVKRLQEILISTNTGPMAQALAGIGATGYFGTYTRDALAEYQAPNGILPSVGYFGSITRAQMTTAGMSGLWW